MPTGFSISLRTVYRDIKALEESGVPLAGEAGVGYSIMEGYRLPPVMFTREEAIAWYTDTGILCPQYRWYQFLIVVKKEMRNSIVPHLLFKIVYLV